MGRAPQHPLLSPVVIALARIRRIAYSSSLDWHHAAQRLINSGSADPTRKVPVVGKIHD